MLSHVAMHSPEGVEELKLRAVEVLRERIGEKKWDFCLSDPVGDTCAITSTIGHGFVDKTELIFATPIPNSHNGYLRVLCEDLFSYLDSAQENAVDPEVTAEQLHAHRVSTRGDKANNYVPPQFKRVYLVVVDTNRWVNGHGWHHRAFYTQDELKKIGYVQVYLSCAQGFFPWEKEYTGEESHRLETKPFGDNEVPNVIANRHPARLRYMH